jgi:hypothetical protein
MHDPHVPAELDPLDGLASAIVDGEAILPVDADPALVDRVAALRNVRAAVAGSVGPPSDAIREAGMAAALGASATSPDIHSLAMRRRRMPVLSTAAVAAALALLFGLGVLSLGDDAREGNLTDVAQTAEIGSSGTVPPTKAAATTTAFASDAFEGAAPSTTTAPTSTPAPSTAAAPVTTFATSASVTMDGGDATDPAAVDAGLLRQSSDVLQQPADGEAFEAGGESPGAAVGIEALPSSADDDAMSFLDESSTVAGSMYFDPFSFLFPHAEEAASSIRAGEAIPAGPAPSIGWPPDCGLDEAGLLDGEEVLDMARIFLDDPMAFGLLYVGPTSWVLVDATTCETFTWPGDDD